MKIFTIFLLFLTTAYSPVLSMDPFSDTKTISLDKPTSENDESRRIFKELITKVDQAINQQYKSTILNPSQISLSKNKMSGILKIIDSYHATKPINNILIEKLREQNSLFKQTMDYRCRLALDNFNLVTCTTLDAVVNPSCAQPHKKFNALRYEIKRYAIDTTYKNIKHLYYITFKGHTNYVEKTDINQKTNRAASASKDGTFRLWKLSNGQPLYTIHQNINNGQVQFSPDGSLLATSTTYRENPARSRITLVSPSSGKALHYLKEKRVITGLTFFPDANNLILAIRKSTAISLYMIKPHAAPAYLGSMNKQIKTKPYEMPWIKKNDDYSWQIKKNSPRLYLCELAITNTQEMNELSTMITTRVYTKLSQNEKNRVQEKLTKKLESFK